MEKILYNRLLRPVLAVVMVVSLLLGTVSSAWPAARKNARIEALAAAGIANLRTLSIEDERTAHRGARCRRV